MKNFAITITIFALFSFGLYYLFSEATIKEGHLSYGEYNVVMDAAPASDIVSPTFSYNTRDQTGKITFLIHTRNNSDSSQIIFEIFPGQWLRLHNLTACYVESNSCSPTSIELKLAKNISQSVTYILSGELRNNSKINISIHTDGYFVPNGVFYFGQVNPNDNGDGNDRRGIYRRKIIIESPGYACKTPGCVFDQTNSLNPLVDNAGTILVSTKENLDNSEPIKFSLNLTDELREESRQRFALLADLFLALFMLCLSAIVQIEWERRKHSKNI